MGVFVILCIMFTAYMVIVPFSMVHILALLGVGEGTPFTNSDAASQKLVRGDVSPYCVIVALVVAVVVICVRGAYFQLPS